MLALDVLLLMMIIVCIVYCWVLNQRIRDLHNSRVEFARMIKEFDAAVIKAGNCISELSTLGAASTSQIKNASIDAEELVHELRTVNDFGNNVSTKLERSLSEARKSTQYLEELIDTASAISVSKTKSKKTSTAASKKEPKLPLEEYDAKDIMGDRLHNNDELMPEHKNLIETVLSKITTHKHKGTVSQSGFYDSLRKVSLKK